MALSTAYYTVDEQIVGESSGGTRLDYLTDALGSVTTKVNQVGAVVSSARYKPYGDLLSGATFTFGWVGCLGYRKSSAGIYVRTRHYELTNSSTWLSIDGYWPVQHAFTYAQSNPTQLSDPSGLSPVHRSYVPGSETSGPCGKVYVQWSFLVSGKKTGWLIQRIRHVWGAVTCKGKPIPFALPDCLIYFEAFKVVKGELLCPTTIGTWQKCKTPVKDEWGIYSAGSCTHGHAEKYGALRFYELNDPTNSWLEDHGITKNSHVGCSLGLPSSKHFSDSASFKDDGKLTSKWACCYVKPPCEVPKCCPDKKQPGSCFDTIIDHLPK